MTIDPTTAGLILSALAYAVTVTVWLARLGARVEHLEAFVRDHADVKQELAALRQGLHNIEGWMRRLDSRIDSIARNQHAAE